MTDKMRDALEKAAAQFEHDRTECLERWRDEDLPIPEQSAALTKSEVYHEMAKVCRAALSTKQEAGECARARLARSFKVGELAAFLHNTMPAKHVNKMNIGEWAALASGALDFLSITPEAGEVSRSQTAGEIVERHYRDAVAPREAKALFNALQEIRALSLPAPDAGWRDMESAPKDGQAILVANEYGHRRIVAWRQHGPMPSWRDHSAAGERSPIEPVAWRPLPAPPVGDGSAPANRGPV